MMSSIAATVKSEERTAAGRRSASRPHSVTLPLALFPRLSCERLTGARDFRVNGESCYKGGKTHATRGQARAVQRQNISGEFNTSAELPYELRLRASIKDPVEHIQRTLDQMGVKLGNPVPGRGREGLESAQTR
jgi:hypothetical protein